MRVFVTGATGVIGRPLVGALVAAGHEVRATVRDPEDERAVRSLGADPTEVDLFDSRAISDAIDGSETIVNLATSIPPLAKMGSRRAWATNDRLRIEGAANLVAAAIDAGVTRFVQPTVTFVYEDGGDRWLDEEAPIRPPSPVTESALDAEAATARFTEAGGTGVVLRLGRMYGPGAASDELVAMLRNGRVIVVGDGENYVSSIHVDDAVTAHLAALELPEGTYNVVDDEPATSLELMSAQAAAVGGRPPRKIPTWLGRVVLRDAFGVLAVSQRVSNHRLREVSGWVPSHPNAVDGAQTLA